MLEKPSNTLKMMRSAESGNLKDRFINHPAAGMILSLAVLTFIFSPVFYSDYAYLDEIHQLWHNKDGSNLTMFIVQGRWLTGLLMNQVFSRLSDISALKTVRISSFLTWALFLVEYFRLGRQWQQWIGFHKTLLLAGGIYIACCPSLAVYIGWASCFEVGLASLLGLWSGHLFFSRIMNSKEKINFLHWQMLLSVVTGICSLLLYQTAFAAFLLPLVFYILDRKSVSSFRIIKSGVIAYILIAALYYGCFLLSLKITALYASDRAAISIDILGKLSFFFSGPIAQAFSLNFLYNLHSIPSQVFPVLLMAGWIGYFWRQDKNKPGKKIIMLLIFLGICMLIYLPVLIARENFSSYRTMFMLNLTVTLLLIDTISSGIPQPAKNKTIALVIAGGIFITVGFRNFRYNYIGPLKIEYQLLTSYFNTHYNTSIHSIYILRPPDNLFYDKFRVNAFKDEFGSASTLRDWTPEPLMKQFILEKTQDRNLAAKMKIIQFTDRQAFETEEKNRRPDALYLDVESLFR
jgi:glucosyltransferase GtrII-like protein